MFRVVVFVPVDDPEPARAERECLDWCERNGVDVYAVTCDPDSAAACVDNGDADFVLAAREPHLRPFLVTDIRIVTDNRGVIPPRQRRTGRVDRRAGGER